MVTVIDNQKIKFNCFFRSINFDDWISSFSPSSSITINQVLAQKNNIDNLLDKTWLEFKSDGFDTDLNDIIKSSLSDLPTNSLPSIGNGHLKVATIVGRPVEISIESKSLIY